MHSLHLQAPRRHVTRLTFVPTVLAISIHYAYLIVRSLPPRIGAPVKTILEDLEHIRKSSKGKNRLVLRQPECNACGFGVRDRTRLNTPSRCPRCGSEQVREPEFSITDTRSG